MIIPDVKKMAGIIVGKMNPEGSEGSIKPEAQMDDSKMGLHAAAEDLINAINSKSALEVADALRSAFIQMDAEEDGAEEEGGEA